MTTLSCSNHPAKSAGYRCRRCDAVLCSECLDGSTASEYRQCKACGSLAVALQADELDVPSGAFLNNLPQVFRCLLEKETWLQLLGLSLVIAAFMSMVGGFLIGIIALGIEASFFFGITLRTATGQRSIDIEHFDFFDSILMPFLLYMACVLPIVGSLYWGYDSLVINIVTLDWEMDLLPQIAFWLSVALFPLLLTVAALSRSLAAIYDPRIWVDTLRTFGSNYIFAVLFFYLTLLAEIYVFPRIALRAAFAVDVFYLSAVVALIILYIPRVLRYRALGVLCEPSLRRSASSLPDLPVESPPAEAIPKAIVTRGSEDLGTGRAEPEASPAPSPVAEDDETARAGLGDLDERELLQAAREALTARRTKRVFRAVERMWKAFPQSESVAPALWLASQAQEMEGDREAMGKTLQTLVARFGSHPLAGEARSKLEALDRA